MSSTVSRALVIGLDCAAPQLVFDRWLDQLPTIRGLTERGAWGVGTGTIHVFENDTGPDDANHAHEGLYILVADGVEPGRAEERDLRDIAPTLLRLLGEEVPADMEGTSLVHG